MEPNAVVFKLIKNTKLLQLALGLQLPWQVGKVEFDSTKCQLTILIGFPKGNRFTCPACSQADCNVHDTEQKRWRHLNFFQHGIFITARVPRSDCPRCGLCGREGDAPHHLHTRVFSIGSVKG